MPSRKRANERNGAKVVVALGGSGANVAGLEECLRLLKPDPEVAAVVILHHREALDEAGFRSALEEAGRAVTEIEDGQLIEGGRIYLPAMDVIVTAEDSHFQTRPAQQDPGGRGTIDSFLVSLARNEDGHSIAVLFANTGSDGTLGAAAIKEGNGLVLAEESDEARTHSLDASTSPAALADIILPAGQLPGRIESHYAQLLANPKGHAARQPGETPAALASIVAVLRNKTGHDFHGYKDGTFWRRIQRRIQVHEAASVDEYLGILRSDADEPQSLFNDLLIGVTQFFRDRQEFELVEREVIPKLFAGKTRNDQVRVWVIGCSTGEEAYSLGILLREHMSTLEEVPQVQVFASDLDGRALASARAGRYTDAVVNDVSPERLARWFVKQGNTYVVAKELREMCIFSQHSIIKDAPFSRLDMVSCRNLLIYLAPDLQARVIPLFHFALRPGGYLFLGNSENVSRHTTLFAPVESRSRVFRRLDTERRVLPDFPFTAVDRQFTAQSPTPRPPAAASDDLGKVAERLAQRYAPAYVIVDRNGAVLHFSGRTGRYIEPAGGTATLNVLNLVHPDLRVDLRGALSRAVEQQQTEYAPNLRMGTNGTSMWVDIVVEPVREGKDPAQFYVVLFKEGADTSSSKDGSVSAAQVQRLEAELHTTAERLQATVEELESTNEELKSANEEYQSLNEELQSANEELETSKEELQSINEELTTVNGELAQRVQELGRANSDLKNFLESTQIATVFLDHDLKVMNYTPAISDIFHLVDTDVGRPIMHIKSQMPFDDLTDDASKVLRTLGTLEREVANPVSGARYIMRILPYRSTANFIAGVVVTFVDITARKKAEEALREREERFRLILESARDYAIFTADLNGIITDWPAGAEAVFGWTPEEAVGRSASLVYVPEDREAHVLERELDRVRENGSAANVRWHQRKDGSRVFIEGSARALTDAFGQVRGMLKIGRDVTESRRADAALRESEARFRAVVDLIPDLLWSSDGEGNVDWFNQRWLDYTGLTLAQAKASGGWYEAVHPDDRERVEAGFRAALTSKQPLALEYRMIGRDGTARWFLMRAEPSEEGSGGAASQWFGSATDIHEQRSAIEAVRASESEALLLLGELQHRVRNTLAVIRSIAQRTATTSTSVEEYGMHLDGRLNAFSRVQAVVTRNPQDGVDLEYLIAEELNAHAAREGEQVDELKGPKVPLQPKAAELLGLAVHELTVNAVKYGALQSDAGHLTIGWTFETVGNQRQLVITWVESGVQLDDAPQRTGFGTELLERTLAHELGGESELTFRPNGIRRVIRLPANDSLIVPSRGNQAS